MRFIIVILTFGFCSCISVDSKRVVHQINIDTSVQIPKELAVKFANEMAGQCQRPGPASWKANFYEDYAVLNREDYFMGPPPFSNKKVLYSDLAVLTEVTSPSTESHKFHNLVLVEKNKLNKSDFYVDRVFVKKKMLNDKYCLYTWTGRTLPDVENKYKKFISALISLGVELSDKPCRQ